MNAEPEAPSLNVQAATGRRGAALAGSGLACIVLFGFMLAPGAQFERYTEPVQPIVPGRR